MLNPRLDNLPGHTWDQLRALLDHLPPGREDPLSLTIGAPKHPTPQFIGDILDRERAGYGQYPPIMGTPDWQQAVIGWLGRRYQLTNIEADQHILPVSGTREGLFNAAFVAVTPSTRPTPVPS